MKKRIALVAHDTQKIVMAEWANKHRNVLKNHTLVGTEKTANTIENITGLSVQPLGHGPDGGDIIIANQVLENNIDILIFFIDARTPHGHEHDIQTLIRISVLKNVPLALNRKTADYMILSQLVDTDKETIIKTSDK